MPREFGRPDPWSTEDSMRFERMREFIPTLLARANELGRKQLKYCLTGVSRQVRNGYAQRGEAVDVKIGKYIVPLCVGEHSIVEFSLTEYDMDKMRGYDFEVAEPFRSAVGFIVGRIVSSVGQELQLASTPAHVHFSSRLYLKPHMMDGPGSDLLEVEHVGDPDTNIVWQVGIASTDRNKATIDSQGILHASAERFRFILSVLWGARYINPADYAGVGAA